jgi:hypothetical protein
MAYKTIAPRARIGFIIPSSNRMVEPQMQRYMPDGVVPHFTRIGMTNRHKAPLEQLLPRILEAAELLADSKCDVTVLQCTGTSTSSGRPASPPSAPLRRSRPLSTRWAPSGWSSFRNPSKRDMTRRKNT